jgi:cytochrome c peroxidase
LHLSRIKTTVALIGIASLFGFGAWWHIPAPLPGHWTAAEIRILKSLSLHSLPPLPADPGNAAADDERAAILGHRLFFDTRLSANGAVACATCHRPELLFTDGLPVAIGAGRGQRNTPGLAGVAFSPWHFWDGRKDSLWSQALAPLENVLEHAGNRMQYVRLLATDAEYRKLYENLFGALPDISDPYRFPAAASPVRESPLREAWQAMQPADQKAVSGVFANLGKAIAAYERQLLHAPAPFDRYVEKVLADAATQQDDVLSKDEVRGLRLFIGKAQCINCHNGPLFTNNTFHNTGVLSAPGQEPAFGRVAAVRVVREDPFNCLGEFSDGGNTDCAELRFVKGGDELIGAHKTPSLRNVALTAPYMHAGQIADLAEVVRHYNRARPAMLGHNEAKPLNLRPVEQKQLISFLHTLTEPLATPQKWLKPPVDLPASKQ